MGSLCIIHALECNIGTCTPFGRDPLRELAVACRKRELRFCIYYCTAKIGTSPSPWKHLGLRLQAGRQSAPVRRKYLNTNQAALEELLTGYGPSASCGSTAECIRGAGPRFAQLVWKYQPHCLVNGG